MASQPAPWNEYRDTAERIGHCVEDAVSHLVGSRVDLGLVAACEPEAFIGSHPFPLRAVVVRFNRPLRDVMVFISSLREETIRPLAEAAAAATLELLEVEQGADRHGPYGAFTIEQCVEFAELETALEQCDGLYLEAMYDLDLPTGEVHMVLGTGLVESAHFCAKGEQDPWAVEPPIELDVPAGDGLVLGEGIGLDQDPERYQLAEGSMVEGDEHELQFGVSADAGSALDALDAQLAEAEQRERAELAALQQQRAAAAEAAAAQPEVAPDAAGADATQTVRWTQLLSGVEVELSAELGRTELSLQDITSLDSEVVLTLDQLVDEPVTVYVNGTPYATARLVAVDGEYGIEILEIIEQAQSTLQLAA